MKLGACLSKEQLARVSWSFLRDDPDMRGEDGLFEVEPVGVERRQRRPAAVDKTFRAFDPHQVLLLPLDDWLPEDHLARFVADLVDDVLDLGPILADYTEKRGYPRMTRG